MYDKYKQEDGILRYFIEYNIMVCLNDYDYNDYKYIKGKMYYQYTYTDEDVLCFVNSVDELLLAYNNIDVFIESKNMNLM